MPLPPIPIVNAMLIDLTASPTFDRIVFTYMPDKFSETKSAEYASVSILGRSEPVMGYASSSARIFNIGLTFIAHGEKSGPMEEVIHPVRLLRSWVYPYYNSQTSSSPSNALHVPPRLLLAVGQWLRQRVILLSYNIEYMAPWGRNDVNADGNNWNRAQPTAFSLGNYTSIDPVNALLNEADQLNELGSSDSLVPYVVQAQAQFQEVVENTAVTPFDTNQVRQGADVLNRTAIRAVITGVH